MITLLVLLIGFGVLHSLLAALPVKAWFEQRIGAVFRFYRIAYNLFFIALLGTIIYILLFAQQAVYIFHPTNSLRFTAAALVFTGIILMGISFAACDLAEFIGISYLQPRQVKKEQLRLDGFYQ